MTSIASRTLYDPPSVKAPDPAGLQKQIFMDGSFVLHKIRGDFVGRMSAWYSPDGRLKDAEQITYHQPGGRPVRLGGPMWRLAERLGRIHRTAD